MTRTFSTARFARGSLTLLAVIALGACSRKQAETVDAGPAANDANETVDGAVSVGKPRNVFELLADPYAPARKVFGRTRVVSSRQPENENAFGNEDFNHTQSSEGTERVLFDARGPGVVTRMWFTAVDVIKGMPDTFDLSVADRLRLHVFVDDTEVSFTNDERGITLAALTSGSLPSFPRPWVLGRDASSGGYVVTVPLHFTRSMRVTVDATPDPSYFYYQIDWHDLPAETVLRPFDGQLSQSELDAMATAKTLWVTATSRGPKTAMAQDTLTPGSTLTVRLDEAAVVRRAALAGDTSRFRNLRGRLVVDDRVVVDAPIERWLMAAAPAVNFDSAAVHTDASRWALDYPAPVRRNAVLTLTNDGFDDVAVTATLNYDPGEPSVDLGALGIECRSSAGAAKGHVTVVELTATAGQYAGQLLTLRGNASDWTMLEGDHQMRVDGNYDVLGTGTEDYFGGAFYFNRGQFAQPFHGAPGKEEGDNRAVAMYRYHIIDPVAFRSDFAFRWESYASNVTYDSCVYYYRF